MTYKLRLLAFVCLLASLVHAQSPVNGAGNSGGGVGISTVALAPTNKPAGTLNVMTDGNATNDCVAGGGANLVLCRWSGSAWGQFAGGTAAAGGSNTQLQWNNATAIGGITQWTTNGTTTITGSATAVLDLSAASATAGLKLPAAAGAAPTTDGVASFNTTSHLPTWGSNGATATIPVNTTATGSQWFSAYNVATGAFTKSQPACGDLSNAAASCATDATNATNIGSGTLAAARMNPSVSAHTFLGNITAGAAAASFVQPACADLSNSSGGCTMSTTASGDISGTLPAATVLKINGNSVPSGAVADQVLIGTGANAFGLTTLPNSTGGAAALTYVVSTHSFGTLSSIVTGTLTSGRMEFANGTNSLTDSANLLYAAASGFTQIQGANGTDAHYIKRFTDTTPTGNFLHFQDAAALNDLFKVDILGNATATSWSTNNAAGNGGQLSLVQGTSPGAVTNAINFLAPASVTTYTLTFPGTIAAGLWRNTSGGTVTYAELSGDCVTSGSNAITCAKVNAVSFPTTGASFDALPILTASNTIGYFQINGGADCGDATHAMKYTQSTHLFGCQVITAAAPGAGGANTQVQFNSANALAGSANFTWVSPVLTIGAAGVTGQVSWAGLTSGTTAIQAAATASGTLTLPAGTGTLLYTGGANTAASGMTLDMSAATGATALKIPVIAGATSGADGVIDYDSTNKNTHIRANAADAIALAIPSAPTTGNLLDASVASSNVLAHDSGIATANVVTAASAASGAKQICTASGASKTCSYIDFPDAKIIPAANCNNATAGPSWSLPATNAPTAACRAGTNNLGGVLQWANNNTTTNAQFTFELPADWDTATQPYWNIVYGSGANTSGTIKWTISSACTKADGSVADDPAFVAETTSGGKTMAAANRGWSESAQFANLTSGNSCVAGSTVLVKVTSGNGTATSTVNVEQLVITVPRLLVVQAN